MSDYRFQIGDKVQRRFAGSNGQQWQNVTITDTDPCGRVLEYQFDDPTYVAIKAYNDDFRPRTVAPDPDPDPDAYASYPTTGVYSPRQQHDADEALITEFNKMQALISKVGGAIERHKSWLNAQIAEQLASLRGEE